MLSPLLSTYSYCENDEVGQCDSGVRMTIPWYSPDYIHMADMGDTIKPSPQVDLTLTT